MNLLYAVPYGDDPIGFYFEISNNLSDLEKEKSHWLDLYTNAYEDLNDEEKDLVDVFDDNSFDYSEEEGYHVGIIPVKGKGQYVILNGMHDEIEAIATDDYKKYLENWKDGFGAVFNMKNSNEAFMKYSGHEQVEPDVSNNAVLTFSSGDVEMKDNASEEQNIKSSLQEVKRFQKIAGL